MTTPPHDLDAEAVLLGAMMLNADIIEQVTAICAATDFYRPANTVLFDTIVRLWLDGEPTDPLSVAAAMRAQQTLEQVGGLGRLSELMAASPVTSSAARYARVVAGHAGVRRVLGLCAEVQTAAYAGAEVDALVDLIRSHVDQLELPVGVMPDGVWSVDEFLARPVETLPPWTIPGLFRSGWRALLVAVEGLGKSMLAHQLALAAAQGVHPFALTAMPAVRTLCVDLENPDERIMDGFRRVTDAVVSKTGAGYEPHRAWLWHRQGGINVRARAGRGQLEAVIAATRPQLVCIGPVYKLYSVSARENDEMAAREVMGVLDDLRVRYGFAMMLEHHAPKKQAGYRDLAPYGSSLWLRWPEFGLTLKPDPKFHVADVPDTHFVVGRFRLDRVEAAWPDRLERSSLGGLPWQASWNDARWQAMVQPELAEF